MEELGVISGLGFDAVPSEGWRQGRGWRAALGGLGDAYAPTITYRGGSTVQAQELYATEPESRGAAEEWASRERRKDISSYGSKLRPGKTANAQWTTQKKDIPRTEEAIRTGEPTPTSMPIPPPTVAVEAMRQETALDTLRANALPVGGGLVALAALIGGVIYWMKR